MDPDTEMKDEDDTFSNSAEDSSSEEDAGDDKIAELKNQVQSNPFAYESHVQLITLCRKLGELEELRSSREKMSKLFPLTPDLWLDWLSDEKSLATTKEQKEDLTALFERAIKDYPSVAVWLEYVQFSIGKAGDTWEADALAIIRQTFERALTAVGIHALQGSLIWEAYREFEGVYLLHLKNKDAVEEVKQQEDRIYTIFKRQLSIPLFDMDSTYAEFRKSYYTNTRTDIRAIDYVYNKALEKLEEIQTFENSLYDSESPHYEEYKVYIQYEKKCGDPSRIQNIYERALVENCLKEELWLDYIKYMDRIIKIGDLSLPIHERAVRNLPWCVQLWVRYFRALEMYEKPHETIKEMFETALKSGFVEAEDFKELWLAYLDYLRRRIKMEDADAGTYDFKDIEEVFNKATIQMAQYFWGSEPEYIILKYWIFFNVKYKKDLDTARECWKELIEHGHKEEARAWLDYANFEKLYGDGSHYRKCLFQALNYVSDWPQTFFDLLLTYEREEGTLESLEKSLSRCEILMQNIKEKQLKKLEEERMEKEDKRRHLSKRQNRISRNDSPSKSDSNLPVQMDSEGFKIPPPPVKLHSSENSLKPETPSDTDSKKNKRSSDEENQPESKKRKVETSGSHGMIVPHDSSKDDRTVFASNLSFKIEEDKIKDFFSQMGEVDEVRLVKDYKGRSKGFCYVLFKTQDDAKNALSKDREPLDGRPVYISSCEDKKNNPSFQPKFKFGTGLERNKLFIKNLPFATTKEDLETMYKEYGPVKDVRIVTYRNGHSKGLAYVEFADEAAASNAVVKTDGTQIMDHVISVAISNPPPRKTNKEFSPASISDSLGGGGGRAAKGPRGRGRTQLSLVPRSVVRAPAGKKSSSHSNNSLQNGQNSDSTSSEEKKPLSNSDFAKMLTK